MKIVRNLLLELFFLFWKKEKPLRIEMWLSKDTKIEEDNDQYDIKTSKVRLYEPYNPNGVSRKISISELRNQVKCYHCLGTKSINFYFANQDLIPESFKKKTLIFLGTIYINEHGHRFAPCLYFNFLREVWLMSFHSFSDAVSLDHNFVPVIDESITSN